MSSETTVVPGDHFEYYQGRYWNDLALVRELLNERCTGDRSQSWQDHLLARHGPFERALVLNCGNGWVERDLLDRGVIGSAVGIDYSEDLLAQARAAAADTDTPLEYRWCDTNAGRLPDGPFDLVVNHAALHHVAYVDRVMRAICDLLPADGILVSYDYVGPHRNQYTAAQWEAAWQLNGRLPDEVRQEMRYPHLSTMLVDDPTEAVHSELIMPTMRRYFRIEHEAELGGAVAYPLLTHNAALHAHPEADVADEVGSIMAVDRERSVAGDLGTFFAYVIARPDKGALDRTDDLDRWTAEEDARERAAGAGDGTYYAPTLVATLTRELDEAGRNPLVGALPPALAERLARLKRRVTGLLARRRTVRPG